MYNNNSINNNELNEKLFFKIFRNIVLWSKISYYLKSENCDGSMLLFTIINSKKNGENINSDKLFKYGSVLNYINRYYTFKKYYEITSVESMIQNNQIELLQDKILKNNNLIEKSKLEFSNKSLKLIIKSIPYSELFKSLVKLKLTVMEKSLFLIDLAVESRDLDKIKFLHEMETNSNDDNGTCNGYDDGSISKSYATTTSMDIACRLGDEEIVHYLHNFRNEGCSKNAMDLASSHGHLEIVKFLHQNRNEGCTKNAIDFAVTNGHLEIVRFLCLNRTEGFTNNSFEFIKRSKQPNKEILLILNQFQSFHNGLTGKKNKFLKDSNNYYLLENNTSNSNSHYNNNNSLNSLSNSLNLNYNNSNNSFTNSLYSLILQSSNFSENNDNNTNNSKWNFWKWNRNNNGSNNNNNNNNNNNGSNNNGNHDSQININDFVIV